MSDWGPITLAGVAVAPGDSVECRLEASEFYTADPLYVPVTVIRGRRPGPTLFTTAAVHGDELNGVAIIRDLLIDQSFEELAGTLIAVPVVNVPGFIGRSRTMPDRRDLNRSFPGRAEGSFTARLADTIYRDIVRKSDFGVDLHTAGGGRANYPQVRADLSDPRVAELATAFGCPLVIDGKGPDGALRRAAVAAGVPTIAYEAGSPAVFERRFIDSGLAGVVNVLRFLGMLPGDPIVPPVAYTIRRSVWLRARAGGMIDLKVTLGEPVRRHQVLSINTNPFGRERSQLQAPSSGVVIGLSRAPLVHPGDPVCHLARLGTGDLDSWHRYWLDQGGGR